ncbi:MAG: hypothetical protein FWC73_14010 [Defluviitaleaceae bacterium]|nr:hypothetical protein [Defluviitaleaceae bacterium]
MIIYYTRSQKTKIFAEALGEILGQPLHGLQSDLDNMKGFKFLTKALGMVFSGKGFPVHNMPDSVPEEIYVCGPIWGGRLVGPVKYFMENTDLSKTKVNLLVTAETPVEKYRNRALEDLARIRCIPGEAYIFATKKDIMPEKEVAVEHLQEMLSGEKS